ncbi:MAG TPA: DegT/DnrJ/EryC1/StrS family aminotransferase [Pirellulales bacterium]|nr:DegT/DnrJ/EryC1/StrS family aminotransferase [Pirellulales bacterium]
MTYLAIDGGKPTLPDGPPNWPAADAEVREALLAAWADGSWGRYHGPHVERLAAALAEFYQSPFVLPCCSGTFAVELALRCLHVGSGDEVLLAGYDYPGNFRAIEAVGARPVLVDVDADNWNLNAKLLPLALDENESWPATRAGATEQHDNKPATRAGATESASALPGRLRAIVVSHLHGGLVPMRDVMQFAKEHHLAVVEDICQCPGAVVDGRPAGTWGDCAALSFGGSKLLSAGRGGAVLTRHADAYQRGKIFCEHGNHAFPLSELQAAVLLPQLARLGERNAARRAAAERLVSWLAGVPGLTPLVNRAASTPVYYKLGFQYDARALGGRTRAEFIAAAQAEGVAIDAGFRGFALRGPGRCRVAGELVESRRAAESCLVLHHPVLLEPPETIDCVANALRKIAIAWRTE